MEIFHCIFNKHKLFKYVLNPHFTTSLFICTPVKSLLVLTKHTVLNVSFVKNNYMSLPVTLLMVGVIETS